MSLWNQFEIERLQLYMNRHANNPCWRDCASFVQSKSIRQCYDYYQLQLATEKKAQNNHKWTAEDNEKLLQFDPRRISWRQFQKQNFEDLTLSQLKNNCNV